VGDVPDDLRRIILLAMDEADIVVVSGGLGPTDDDRSTEVVAELLGCELEVDRTSFERARAFFGAWDGKCCRVT
jgi:nicotinamide-nucleotide amidase